jgi:hypothetical protein
VEDDRRGARGVSTSNTADRSTWIPGDSGRLSARGPKFPPASRAGDSGRFPLRYAARGGPFPSTGYSGDGPAGFPTACAIRTSRLDRARSLGDSRQGFTGRESAPTQQPDASDSSDVSPRRVDRFTARFRWRIARNPRRDLPRIGPHRRVEPDARRVCSRRRIVLRTSPFGRVRRLVTPPRSQSRGDPIGAHAMSRAAPRRRPSGLGLRHSATLYECGCTLRASGEGPSPRPGGSTDRLVRVIRWSYTA